ncbi:beta-1,3-glucan-binding protein-like [Littorina saxatilis]|uniref:GH16 domain-containing protein n=1 Tax=Littorina saxatilis TaxID=31220 RepID=A0AAN9BBA2_9CAEN
MGNFVWTTVVAVIFFVSSSLARSPAWRRQDKGLNVSVSDPGSEHYLRRRGTTVFYDDFSSGHIDPKKWTHDITAVGMANYEIWSPESRNSYVKNGHLYIKPTLTVDRFGSDVFNHGTIDVRKTWGTCQPTWGSCVTHGRENRPFMSALLRSSGHIRYGRVEVVAKLPRGDWIWPAIWMMPVDPGHYGPWPRSGEIDIVEAVGNEHLKHPNGLSVGVDCDHAHFNFGSERDGPGHLRYKGEYRLKGTTFAGDFHTFWLDWTENHIKLGVDSKTVLTVNTPPGGYRNNTHLKGTHYWDHGSLSAPFDKPFYLILDVAVGGAFFWDDYINSPYKRPWTDDATGYYQLWQARHLWQPTWHGEDTAMRVKSVKMVQY